jgi:hypothetical protein
METEEHQQRTTKSHISLSLKGGALPLLFLLSTLIIACSASNATTTSNLVSPQATFTIHLSNNTSSIPVVASYLCGAWITDTTPIFKPGNKIPVYAHFIHNVNGNPVGVTGANAQAHIEWADGYRDNEVAITQSDGLAVFYFTIPNRPTMVDRNNLVMVSFTGPNGKTCNVDNQPQPAAFFTLINGRSTPEASPIALPPKRQKRRKGG